jgi:hypothetical protein
MKLPGPLAVSASILCALLASCGGSGTPHSAGGTPVMSAAFPLKVGSTGRYLVDQNNKPFLIVGDAPQALMVNLSAADAEAYFANRAKRGFNAVWINLLCSDYTGGRTDGSTLTGVVPFTTPMDLSTPNEAYFAQCDNMIRLAGKYGLVVFLDPAETGSFLSVMLNNGLAKCTAYGQFLGSRYKSFDNIVWMSGNDFQTWTDPISDSVVSAVALGIKQTDTRHIHTVELDYLLSSSTDDPVWANIVSLNGAYTYYPTYAEVLQDYNRSPAMPVFMEESDYEFENGADPQRLRREAYWTFLSGATGEIYGNHYVWPFLSGWQHELDTPGAFQLGYAKGMLQARPWYSLVPDQQHTILTTGYGTFSGGGSAHSSISSNDYVAAAATADGRLFIAYIPTARTVTIDMTKLSAPVTARWFDPSNGAFKSAAASVLQNTGSHAFTSPGLNAEGGASSDWVLLLEVNPV